MGVILPFRGHVAIFGHIFGCHTGKGEWICYWHLVHRGQGCFYMMYRTALQQRAVRPKMAIVPRRRHPGLEEGKQPWAQETTPKVGQAQCIKMVLNSFLMQAKGLSEALPPESF